MGRGLDSPRAWGVVAAAFAATFVAFGIAYSYGAFLEEMRADFGVGRAAGAAFFSLTSLLYFGLGGVSGAASDRFGPRRVLLVGAVALGLGLVATARAQSVGVALGAYVLGVGIGVGTLTIPPATAALIEAVGWRDSYLVLAAAGAGALALCALAVAPAPAVHGAAAVSLGDALRDRQYRRLYLATALLGVPLFVPFVYLPSYAEERGVDPVLAAGLIGAIGTASVAGRLALGALAAPLGLLRVFRGCFLAMALSFVLWWVAGGSYPLLLLFASVLGVGYGGYVALAPAVVAERFGVERLGALLGVLYTSAGIGSAVGPPAAGAVIDAGGYTPAIAASLAIGLAAFAVAAMR